MAAHFPDEDLEQKYKGTTVLTTGRILNPIAAVQEALAIYQLNRLHEPPRNTSFPIIWFPWKSRITPSQTFVIFKRSAPPELKYTHLWDCSILEDVFGGAQSNYLETEDSFCYISRFFLLEVTIYTQKTQVGVKKLTVVSFLFVCPSYFVCAFSVI